MKISEINKNSLEAIIFFVLYICAQDKIIDDLEIDKLKKNLISVKDIYFDKFESVSNLLINNLVEEISNFFKKDGMGLCENVVTEDEIKLMTNLISSKSIQEIALIAAIEAASADGFHKIESKKYKYWNNKWSDNF